MVGRSSVVQLREVSIGIGMREHRRKGEDGTSKSSAWYSRPAPTVPVAIRIAAAVFG